MRRGLLEPFSPPCTHQRVARAGAPGITRGGRYYARVRTALAVAFVLLGATWIAAGQMRRSGIPTSSQPQAQDVPGSRIERLQQWLAAVDRHEPGVEDDAVIDVGGWSNSDLRGLWIDVASLSQLMR